MALHFDLKVNGDTIGTFEARRLWPAAGGDTDAQQYGVHVRETRPGEVTGSNFMVDHVPADGAWELIRKALEHMGPTTPTHIRRNR